MKNESKENRKFGLVLGVTFIVISTYLFFRKDINPMLASIGFILLLTAILVPQKLTLLKEAWEKLGEILGQINTIILLTIVYCIILTPVSWVIKLLGKDPLKLKTNPNAKSYWEQRSTEEKGTFKQQF